MYTCDAERAKVMCACNAECAKVLWLSGTDAVVHPEYFTLLTTLWEELVVWTCCSEACVLARMSKYKGVVPIEYLMERLLSNKHAPKHLLSWTISNCKESELESVQNLAKFVKL